LAGIESDAPQSHAFGSPRRTHSASTDRGLEWTTRPRRVPRIRRLGGSVAAGHRPRGDRSRGQGLGGV